MNNTRKTYANICPLWGSFRKTLIVEFYFYFYVRCGCGLFLCEQNGFRAGSKSEGATNEAVRETPKVLQLSLIEAWLLRVLKPLAMAGMGSGVPDDKKGYFFYRFGSTDEVCSRLPWDAMLRLWC